MKVVGKHAVHKFSMKSGVLRLTETLPWYKPAVKIRLQLQVIWNYGY